MLAFDLLYLDDTCRTLIQKACARSSHVWLAPLDKGLSGSSVWLARWKLNSGAVSKHHVLKIGERTKLQREYDAARDIASVLVRGFPNIELYPDELTDRALLRQEFAGDPKGETRSLRLFLQGLRDPDRGEQTIQRLYYERMAPWHPKPDVTGGHEFHTKMMALKDALDWWVARTDLGKAAAEIGRDELDASLNKRFGVTVEDLELDLNELGTREESIQIGPVHGDLHAQNVVLDEQEDLQLIDFGWTGEKWRAVDFLMMECSLKFLVSPPHALLDDLLCLDTLLDESTADYTRLGKCLHGADLLTTAACARSVRRCAQELAAAGSSDQYKRGLVLLTAGLASIPIGINRVFLFHSLAYQVTRLR